MVTHRRFAQVTTKEWSEYFTHNSETLLDIPWHAGVEFTPEERRDLAVSLQEFQLGESSEGKHLIREGKRYAIQSGDSEYPRALGLFIAEEHRHARDLGRVIDLAGIPRIGHAWPDTAFRWLRHRAGLEVSISILLTAEIIAKVYYAALKDASTSIVLQRLCEQILRDEKKHVEFQSHRLALLRRDRSALSIRLGRSLHHVLFKGTCIVVWMSHGRVFKRGGYSLSRFFSESNRELTDAMDRADPNCYEEGRERQPATKVIRPMSIVEST
jgi:hypothetical protein